MQCNAMYVQSVRPWNEVSQSFFFIFFIFFFVSMYGVRRYVRTRMSRMDRQVSVFFLSVCTNVTDGQTSFSYFSSVSVQSHTVKKSVRPYGGPNKKRKKKCYRQTQKQIRSNYIHSMEKNLLLNLFALNLLNVTDGTIQNKHAVLLTLRSVSMQCNAMQCNTIQCNAIQCNAIQCHNAMYVRKSVRPYGMKSVSHFFLFFYFFSQYVRKSVSMYGTNVTDGQTSFSYFLVDMYECHGWTDKFQLFQSVFQFSRIQSSKSVRPYGGPNQKKKKRKKKKMLQTNTQKHRSDRR
jgi:hypothetical protein